MRRGSRLNRFRHAFVRLVLATSFGGTILVIPTSATANTWTSPGNVTRLYSHNGRHFVETTIPDDSCGVAGKFWWLATDSDAKDMFALALTAYVSGARIQVNYDDVLPSCLLSGAEGVMVAITD